MDEEKTNDGYSLTHLPLYQSLTEHVLFAGAPTSVLALLAVVTLLFVAMFHFYYIVAITLPVYFIVVYLARDDAQLFDCYFVYKTKSDYYST